MAEASLGLSSVLLSPRSHFSGILGSSCDYVATCWRQDGDQERQDEPTWAKQGLARNATGCDGCFEGGCGALKSRNKPITTTKVEQSPATPLHALRAEGTVADIFVCI